jgi:hypothetical protein
MQDNKPSESHFFLLTGSFFSGIFNLQIASKKKPGDMEG